MSDRPERYGQKNPSDRECVCYRDLDNPDREQEEDSCEDERMRLAIYDKTGLEAAKAIKESDHWADNHWPSPNERIWYMEAQKEIARLRAEVAYMRDHPGWVPPIPERREPQ